MKKVHIMYILIFFGCSTNSNTQNNQRTKIESQATELPIEKDHKYSTENQDQVINGLFKNTPFIDSLLLEDFQKVFLDQLIANGDGEFESDSAYAIDSVKRYDIKFGYSIFYIRGHFIPSTVDFHYYGCYRGDEIQYDIYHLPIDTYFTLTKYEYTNNYLKVYGVLDNDNTENADESLLLGLTKKE